MASVEIEDVNWIGETQQSVETKVRSLAPPVGACRTDGGVRFDAPQFGVAPGQSAVFYEGERLLGGGTIVRTEAAA